MQPTREKPSPETASSPSPTTSGGVGLLPRLVLALAIVGLVPILALALQLVGVNRNALTEQVLRSHAVAADAAASQVQVEISARRTFLRVAAAEGGWSSVEVESIRSRLSILLEEAEDLGLVALSLADAGGREVLRAQREVAPAEVSRLIAEQGAASDTFVAFEGARWFVARRALARDSRGLFLVGVFDTLETDRSLHPDELGPEATVWLAEEERVLWGSGASSEEVPPSLLTLAAEQRLSGAGRFGHRGVEYLGAFSPVLDSPWFVVSLQSSAVAERVSRDMRRRSVLAIGLALGLVLLLSALGYRSVVAPLRRLIASQSEVLGEAADFRGDEISRLKSSFEALARHVSQDEALDKVFLGRYQVLEVIGEGAMGSVFMGWDPILKRPVAIKTLKLSGQLESDLTPSGDLLTEAATIARLNHPNVVQVYDVQDAAETSFIAMEFVSGDSLRTHLGRQRQLPIPMAIHVCHSVATALAAAHHEGVLHYDIKPGNVLIREDGRTKITDFGISHAMTNLSKESGFLYGTPGYLPPETILGEGRDERSDLFALGVMAYRCVVGEEPFTGGSLRAVLLQTLQAEVAVPASRRPGIPPGLDELIMDLLRKDPAERLSSAREAARRFGELARQHPWEGAEADRREQDEASPATATVDLGGAIISAQLLQTVRIPSSASSNLPTHSVTDPRSKNQ
ncbi:MAG: serine/threonine-protein kinase [Acidobacteriota bacterium]